MRRSSRVPESSKAYLSKDWVTERIAKISEDVSTTTAGARTGDPLPCDFDESRSYKEAMRSPRAAY